MITATVKLIRFMIRFLSGRPLHGKRRTNATFLQPATESYRKGTATPWDCLPGWQRGAVRLASVMALPVGLVLFCASPKVAMVLGAVCLVGAIFLVVRMATAKGQNNAHYRNVLWPLHHTLTGVLKVKVANPDAWLSVPVNYRTDPVASVRIRVPLNNALTDTTKKRVEGAVRNKLAIGDWAATWRTAGSNPSVTFRPMAPIPNFVDLFNAWPHIHKVKKSEVVTGVARGDRLATIDLDSESPHILVSGETGCGKSALAMWIAIQALDKGARVIICDIKGSHRWAKGMPGVDYYRDTHNIGRTLEWLADEASRRNDESWNSDKPIKHRRIVLIFEESKSTLSRLTKHWQSTRTREDPRVSPAVDGFSELLSMGRSAFVNVILLAQSGTVASTGGTENRENFGLRLLGRCTTNQVAMLTGVRNGPRCSRHPGRWLMFISGHFTEIQVPFAGKDEDPRVRARIAQILDAVPCPKQPSDQGQSLGHETSVRHGTAKEQPEPESCGVGLREAVDAGLLGAVKLSTARKKLQRAGDSAPKPIDVTTKNERLYDPDVLVSWFRANEK